MHVLLGLGYLTRDDILKFHPFACKIHDVFILPHCLYLFFSWKASSLFPDSSYY